MAKTGLKLMVKTMNKTPKCIRCGGPVEKQRECYNSPICCDCSPQPTPLVEKTYHKDGTHSLHIPPELMPDTKAPSAADRTQIMRALLGDNCVDEIEQWDKTGFRPK